MKRFIFFCVWFGFVFSPMVSANSEVIGKKMNVEALLDNYLLSWATKDEEQRLALLNQVWVERGEHQSPFGHSKGVDAINQEISGFLQLNPDVTVKFENIKQTGLNVVSDFIVTKSDGSVWIAGTDYFEFNDDGKLLKVIGFIPGGVLNEGNNDDVIEQFEKAQLEHRTLTQYYRWFLAFELKQNEARIKNHLELFVDDVRIETSSRSMEGESGIRGFLTAVKDWRNAHHVGDVKIKNKK